MTYNRVPRPFHYLSSISPSLPFGHSALLSHKAAMLCRPLHFVVFATGAIWPASAFLFLMLPLTKEFKLLRPDAVSEQDPERPH